MVSHLSDTVDCLYDTYRYQTNQLVGYGYTKEEAFWIHFASVSFMPWSEGAKNLVPLSHILKFYAQIYRDEIMSSKDNKPRAFIRCFLESRFDLIYALAKRACADESISEFALDIGKCVLPHVNDTFKHALAGIFIINAMPVSQRVGQYLPLGRLVLDIGKNYDAKKLKGSTIQKPVNKIVVLGVKKVSVASGSPL
jgi:hypothetical protein